MQVLELKIPAASWKILTDLKKGATGSCNSAVFKAGVAWVLLNHCIHQNVSSISRAGNVC